MRLLAMPVAAALLLLCANAPAALAGSDVVAELRRMRDDGLLTPQVC